MSKNEIREMRDWLLDCFPDEYCQESIEQASEAKILKAINRFYDGGVEAFQNSIRNYNAF